MSKTNNVIRLARKLSLKHLVKSAVDANEIKQEVEQTLWTAINNAASQGLSAGLGIAPFRKMQEQDGVDLSFNVTRSGSWAGGVKITVDNVAISPSNPALLPKYLPLAEQIKKYLEKYPEVYPGSHQGDQVKYDNFVATLVYKAPTATAPDNRIARN